MPYLQPTFAEEFHVAQDDQTLAIDFWAYLNARQANLGWEPADDRLWQHIDEVLREVKPVVSGGEEVGVSLGALARHWRQGADENSANADPEKHELRRELAAMLLAAKDEQRIASAIRVKGERARHR